MAITVVGVAELIASNQSEIWLQHIKRERESAKEREREREKAEVRVSEVFLITCQADLVAGNRRAPLPYPLPCPVLCQTNHL